MRKGQSEAALAMGYSRTRTFWKIVFPQAARHFLPVLKGEFISMVKMTSVVGYAAVVDLTKASDLIRSRTMEAFFPLIATAVIYFAVANLLTSALSLAERRLKVFKESITSRDFDFIGVTGRLEEFGRKHMIAQRTIYQMQTVFLGNR